MLRTFKVRGWIKRFECQQTILRYYLSVKLYKHKKKKKIKEKLKNKISLTFLYISVIQIVLQWLIPCIDLDYMHHEIAAFISFTIVFFYSLKGRTMLFTINNGSNCMLYRCCKSGIYIGLV